MIRDAYGRPLKSLRVSLTRACNFNCMFCHSEGMPPNGKGLLGPRHYEVISNAFKVLEVSSVKFTGGEPLLRRDVVEIVSAFSTYPDVSMTTNGYLLKDKACDLMEAGLKRVNVSLHSLKPNRFARITGTSPAAFERVLTGIMTAKECGLKVALNFVLLKGVNEDEVIDIIEFAAKNGFNLHIIELHPVGKGAQTFTTMHSQLEEVKKYLEERASFKKIRDLHNRPQYYVDGIVVELVEPVGNPYFCAGCTRLRLSPEGLLYPCLNVNDVYVDLKEIIDKSESYIEAVDNVIDAVLFLNDLRKPYYMWNLEFEKRINIKIKPPFRLWLPKRAKLQFLRSNLKTVKK